MEVLKTIVLVGGLAGAVVAGLLALIFGVEAIVERFDEPLERRRRQRRKHR